MSHFRYRRVFTMAGMAVQDPRNPCSPSPESVFTMPGIRVHAPRNGRSGSTGIGVHDGPEYASYIEGRKHLPVIDLRRAAWPAGL
jgi:hypothetical protein